MTTFTDFGLSETLNISLSKMGYTEPTPIQEAAIPVAIKGRDVLGSAQTGTGKTAAFSIPMIEALLRSDSGSAVVLTPTRELAKQVMMVIQQLIGHKSPLNTAFIIGGEPMGKQFAQLRRNPRIIVGTPGRINDHLNRGSMNLHDADFLVLDETDRMLDMGFGIQIDAILEHMPSERQTLMFSATMPQEIVRLSKKYLHNPERISIGATNVVATNIKQEIIRIDQDKKYKELVSQLYEREGTIIVFAKTKRGADRMAKNLNRDGFTADALHGDLRQNKRDRVMKSYRNKKFRILVATDIAARGLDVPHIMHVINYDLPQVAEDYIHRMGRTARAGAEGSALCFISPQDGRKWHAIECLLDPKKQANDGGNRSNNSGRGKKNYKSSGNKSRYKKRDNFRKDGAPKQRVSNRRDEDSRDSKPTYGKQKTYSKSNNRPSGERNDRNDRNSGEQRREYSKPRRSNENRGQEGRSYEGRSHNGNRDESRGNGNRNYDRRDDRRDGARGSHGKPAHAKSTARSSAYKGKSEYGQRDERASGNSENSNNKFRKDRKPRGTANKNGSYNNNDSRDGVKSGYKGAPKKGGYKGGHQGKSNAGKSGGHKSGGYKGGPKKSGNFKGGNAPRSRSNRAA